jgi:hypothetical protein
MIWKQFSRPTFVMELNNLLVRLSHRRISPCFRVELQKHLANLFRVQARLVARRSALFLHYRFVCPTVFLGLRVRKYRELLTQMSIVK